MTLSTWFTCNELQLPQHVTATFIDVENCLTDPARSPDLVAAALAAVATADRRVQVLAIPALVRLLGRGDSDGDTLVTAAEVLAAAAGSAASLKDLAGLADMTPLELADFIGTMRVPRVNRAFTDFADLLESGPHILGLALLREAVRAGAESAIGDDDLDEQPGAYVAHLLRGQDQLWYFEPARRGELGRLPQLLASETLLETGEPPDTLATELGMTTIGPWAGQPDLVQIWFQLQMKHQNVAPGPARARWLINEAATFESFATRCDARSYPGMQWLDMYSRAERSAQLVLWQAVAWAQAVAEDAPTAAEMLSIPWAAPTALDGSTTVKLSHVAGDRRVMSQWLQYLVTLRPPSPASRSRKVRLSDHDDLEAQRTAYAYVFSPWLDRASGRYHASDYQDKSLNMPPRTFVFIDDNVAMLRLLGNARTVINLIEQLQGSDTKVPGYLWDLFVNILDVIGNARIRERIRELAKDDGPANNSHRLDDKLVGLALSVQEHAFRLGRGWLVPSVPAALAGHLNDVVEARHPLVVPQLEFLYQQAAFMAVSHQAWESLSGELVTANDEHRSPWFVDGTASPAARVLTMILGPVWDKLGDDPSKSIQEPAILAKDAFPVMFAHTGRSWSWWQTYTEGGKTTVGDRLIELSPPVSLADWEQLGTLDRGRFTDSAAMLAACTQRLGALLSAGRAEPEHEWFVDWRTLMEQLNHQSALPRAVRQALVRVIDHVPTTDVEVDVQRAVLRAVLEFSSGAIHYQDRAGKALLASVEQQGDLEGTVGQFASEWLYALSLPIPRPAHVFRDPWTLVGEDTLRSQRRAAVQAFLARVFELAGGWGGFAMDLESIDAAKTSPLVDTREGAIPGHRVLASQHLRDGHWAALNGSTDVVDPDVLGPARAQNGHDRLGVVAGMRGEPPESTALVNVGGEDSELRNAPLDLGRPVLVGPTLVRDLPEPLARPDDHLFATVSWRDGTLTVAPRGRQPWTLAGARGEALQQWLPDLLGAQGGDAERDCLVTRSTNGGWLPFPRDYSRLLVEQFTSFGDERELVIVGESSGGAEWDVHAGLGRNYRVPAAAMTTDLRAALEAARTTPGASRERTLAGLRVTVSLARSDGGLLLGLADVPAAIDDANLRWRDQFSGDSVVVARRSGDRWFVDAALGHDEHRPIEITFEGNWPPDVLEARVRFTSHSWSQLAQRGVGVVRVRYLPEVRLPVADWFNHVALQEFLQVARGSEVTLGALTGGIGTPFVDAVTEHGLPVRVAADSLSLLPGEPRAEMVAGRRAVAIRAPLLTRRTEDRSSTVPVALDALDGVRSVKGLVSRFSAGDDDVELWLDAGDHAARVTVQRNAFATAIGSVGARVTGELEADGWVFTSEDAVLYTRALWSFDDAPAPDDAVALTVADIPERGPMLVSQSPGRAVLFLGSPSGVDRQSLTCGVPSSGRERVTVSMKSFYRDKSEQLPDVVAVETPEGTFFGASARGRFDRAGQWRTVSLAVRPHHADGTEFFDVRREFTPGKAPKRAPTASSPIAPADAAKPAMTYSQWVREGRRHTHAEFVDGQRRLVRLTEFAVPRDPHGSGPDQIDVVELAPRQYPLLRGRPYDKKEIRVDLTFSDGRWLASYTRVAPLTLEEFAREQLPPVGTTERMWFAGRTREGRYRFEWGYGWTLEVSRDELEPQNGKLRYFFGDGVERLSVVRDSTREGGLRLKVGHVRWEVERRVDDDAGRDILQQVKVRIHENDAGRKWVSVLGVHTRTRQVIQRGGRFPAATYENMFNAEFDKVSERLILEQAAAASRKTDVVTVLARLDPNWATVNPDRHRLVFKVLLPGGGDDDPERQPRAGESVVMIAGSIKQTGGAGDRAGNDYLVEFHLTGEDESDDPMLSATVLRRQFSLRESTLRQSFSVNPDEFKGVPMLVRLQTQTGDTSWEGSLIGAPTRPAHAVKSWVTSDPGKAYVTVGTPREGMVLVEPHPGVITRLSVGNSKLTRGSLCRLEVISDTEHRFLVVVPGESRYVPTAGRAVHLLLKDDALHNNAQNRTQMGFTVAGFPSLTVNDPTAARQQRFQAPPRLGFLRRRGDRLVLDPDGTVNVGRLVTEAPLVRSVKQSAPPKDLDWPVLSFMDDKPQALARHTERGEWHYHDRHTGFFRNGGFTPVELANPARSKDGPLFFDDEWRLRYRTADFDRFGYSANEVLDYGLPKDGQWYPVAAPVEQGGLWVELSPGRIVELRAGLLHSPALTSSALGGFPWRAFAPGDQLRLKQVRDRDASLNHLVVSDWKPGPRGWFGASRALVTVEHIEGGAIVLGTGLASLTWSGGSTPEDCAAVWLDPLNVLTPYADDIAPGDTVTLVLDGEHLRVSGASGWAVELADDWGEYAWLRARLADQGTERTAVFDAHLGGLPARVVEVRDGSLTVGPTWTPVGGRRIAGHVLGASNDENLLFRCGSALLELPTADVLPGIPKQQRSAVVAQLSQRKTLVWLAKHKDGARWVSPVGSRRQADLHHVRGLVAADGGIVCENATDLGLDWLPSSEVGFAHNVPPDLLLRAVTAEGARLPVRSGGNGRASYLTTPEGRSVTAQLESRQSLQAVPRAELSRVGDHEIVYVATLFPTVAPLLLHTERELAIGKPVPVEIEQRPDGPIAIPIGHTRVPFHLSPWLVAALRECRVAGPDGGGWRDETRLADALRPRAARYQVDGAHGDDAESLEVRLVRAAIDASSNPAESSPDAAGLITEWLAGVGGRALTGATADVAADPYGWDVAPFLSAVILLAGQGERDPEGPWRQLAVHAAHCLGRLAAGTQHQEVLVRSWLLPPTGSPRHGRWVRLARLDLGGRTLPVMGQDPGRNPYADPYVDKKSKDDPYFDGKLTKPQYDQLTACCRGILNSHREPDASLVATARSLLFAVGDVERVDELCRDLEGTFLAALAALGRGLTPGTDVAVAQTLLSPGQVAFLRVRLGKLLNDGVPLSFLPEHAVPLPTRSADWAREQIDGILERVSTTA